MLESVVRLAFSTEVGAYFIGWNQLIIWLSEWLCQNRSCRHLVTVSQYALLPPPLWRNITMLPLTLRPRWTDRICGDYRAGLLEAVVGWGGGRGGLSSVGSMRTVGGGSGRGKSVHDRHSRVLYTYNIYRGCVGHLKPVLRTYYVGANSLFT